MTNDIIPAIKMLKLVLTIFFFPVMGSINMQARENTDKNAFSIMLYGRKLYN